MSGKKSKLKIGPNINISKSSFDPNPNVKVQNRK
jgi:hypothetical protein